MFLGRKKNILHRRHLVGFHGPARIKELNRLFTAAATQTGVIQVYGTTTKSCDMPTDAKISAIYKEAGRQGLEIVWHGPYTTNLCRKTCKTYGWTREYILEFFKIASKYHKGPIRLVIHTGAPVKSDHYKGLQDLWFSMNELHKKLRTNVPDNCILAIENSARSYYKYTDNPTALGSISTECYRITSPQIKCCFDTEHLWASGWDITDLQNIELLPWDNIAVIHLNCIPQDVELGSGIDRHGKVSLEESTNFSTGWVQKIMAAGKKHKIPMIFERSNAVALGKDIAFADRVWSTV
jgi:endonuclease IV